MRAVPIQNALVRMRSTYSRRMTAKIFVQFMTSSLDRPRFLESRCPDRGEVDLLELRLSVRERSHFVAIARAAQTLQREGAGRDEQNVGDVDRFAARHSGESGNLAGRRFHRDAQLSLRVLTFQVLEPALENFLRLGNEADLIAEFLRLF